jgi:diguanylate cyclase (GGDEF)-like protein
MDYCEINIKRHRAFTFALLIIPAINLVLAWTTEYTHLVYKDFAYSIDAVVRGLEITVGPAYYLVYGYTLLCIAASVIIIINRMHNWNKSYRFPLALLMLGGLAPLIANVIYLLLLLSFKSSLAGINLTPFALVITYLLFYVNVLRYDLFDFDPHAKTVTINMIRDGILFLDDQLQYSSSNKIAQSLLPGLANFTKGKKISELESLPEELANLKISDTYQDIEFSIPSENNEPRVYNAWVNSVRNGRKVLGVVILIQDITENILLLKQLKNAAYTDELTGIYNRRHFIELAAMSLDRARRMDLPCSILLFDLDFFKKVNDTYGHLAGDEVLRFVARRVKDTLRAYDIFARYGGEEFVVFLTETNKDVAMRLAERIRHNVEAQPCEFEGKEIHITCSIGVAEFKKDSSIEDVLGAADDAMYKAKESGRNCVCAM